MDRSHGTPRFWDLVTALVFPVAISVPLLVMVTRTTAVHAAGEQRAAVAQPALRWGREDLEAYPDEFEAWFADSFGMRGELVRANNQLEWFQLGSSPTPKVVPGKDGWLFYDGHDSLAYSLGARPLSEDELSLWKRVIEARWRWCRARGIEYLFVLGPTKVSMYPERLPSRYEVVGPSRLAQLHDHLDEQSRAPTLDLRPTLRRAIEEDRPEVGDFVYYPHGTHWSPRGDVAVYGALVEALTDLGALRGPQRTPRPFRDPVLQPGSSGPDTWAGRLYLEGLLEQAHWRVAPRAQLPASIPFPHTRNGRAYGDEELPGYLALHHDSYGAPLRPWLAWHFGRVDGYWSHRWQTARIEASGATVVVDFMVERMLHQLDPRDLWPDDQERLKERFDKRSGARPTPELRVPAPNKSAQLEEGLVVDRRQRFVLAELDLGPTAREVDLVVALEVTAPRAVMLELVYPSGAGFDRSRAERVLVEPGRQVVHLELIGERLQGSTVMQLGAHGAGRRWVIHRIEVGRVRSPRREAADD